MATFTVTNLNDSGPGSLRAAITVANADSSGTATVINFTVNGTITLNSALPTITQGTTINATTAPTARRRDGRRMAGRRDRRLQWRWRCRHPVACPGRRRVCPGPRSMSDTSHSISNARDMPMRGFLVVLYR